MFGTGLIMRGPEAEGDLEGEGGRYSEEE